jgi:hypothetical protein
MAWSVTATATVTAAAGVVGATATLLFSIPECATSAPSFCATPFAPFFTPPLGSLLGSFGFVLLVSCCHG